MIYFDYKRQAWVVDGKYVRCGHPETANCACYGRLHEGGEVRTEADAQRDNITSPVLKALFDASEAL